MEDHGSASSTEFSRTRSFRETWKRYKSFTTRYYQQNKKNNNNGIPHEGVKALPSHRHHQDSHQTGCFRALLGTPTRSKYRAAGHQNPQGPASLLGSTPSNSFRDGNLECGGDTAIASTGERKTTKSMGRIQSESATRWAAKRSGNEGRATSTVRRASSSIGVESRPQRKGSFNRTMSNRDDDRNDAVSYSSSMIYGRSSSVLSGNGHHRHHVLVFSSSSGLLKPPSIDQVLECTLEELCFGCVKKMGVTRDVISSYGQISQEEEVLKINVKPGWTEGTKITFPGSLLVVDRPGDYAADVVFTVIQKPHPVFTREDDDLIMDIDIPLVNALTGCNLTIPLLGTGDEDSSMSVDIHEHVVYPGFEKIISGQGMPNQKQPESRGDLRIKFHVQFPNVLTHAQRSEIYDILNAVC